MRSTAIAVGAVAGLLVLPAAAGAKIVPQQGMKGVKLGQSTATVRARLGAPDKVARLRSDIQGHVLVYRYGNVKITFDSAGDSAQNFFTRGSTQRTAGGVGVGSKEAAVKADLPRVKCKTEFGLRHCFLGSFRPGRRVTDFRLSKRTGKVTSVDVGVVID